MISISMLKKHNFLIKLLIFLLKIIRFTKKKNKKIEILFYKIKYLI